MLKIYKVVDIDDCAKALEAVTKFGTDHATERDQISSELAAARADKAYETALKAEIKKGMDKVKGLKKPKCAADKDVRTALRAALPAGM